MLCISRFIVTLPRYARVNCLKTEMHQVEEELANCGYELVCQKDFNSHHCPLSSGSCTCTTFCKDRHIPELLAFCPSAPLTSTKLYASGNVIIQDKVRCTCKCVCTCRVHGKVGVAQPSRLSNILTMC